MRFKVSSDVIQLGLLVLTFISMVGGAWVYFESRFASGEAVTSLSHRVDKLGNEVHEIYTLFIVKPRNAGNADADTN